MMMIRAVCNGFHNLTLMCVDPVAVRLTQQIYRMFKLSSLHNFPPVSKDRYRLKIDVRR